MSFENNSCRSLKPIAYACHALRRNGKARATPRRFSSTVRPKWKESEMNISMRSYVVIIDLGFLLMLGLCSCSRASNETVNSAASEVETREVAFAKTMEDRDLEAFLSFISPEAVFFNGNVPLRGHDAITQVWAPLFEDETAPFSWQPDVIEVLESGRLALSSGPIRGVSGEILGRFNSIWRKDNDGQWRVVFDKGS